MGPRRPLRLQGRHQAHAGEGGKESARAGRGLQLWGLHADGYRRLYAAGGARPVRPREPVGVVRHGEEWRGGRGCLALLHERALEREGGGR